MRTIILLLMTAFVLSGCSSSVRPAYSDTADVTDAMRAQADLPLVVVDFWAPWCGPCKQFAPVFEQAAGVLEPQVRLAKVNTEAEPALAQRFAIRSIPTLIVFRNGKEVNRMSGALPGNALVQWVRQQTG